MLAAHHWEALQLDPLDVRQLRLFLELYEQNLADPPPTVEQLLERRGSGARDDDGLIPYEEPPDPPGYGWDEPPGPPGGPGGRQVAGASADVLRDTAVAAVMTGDDEVGIAALARSATTYLALGLPYGAFLGTAAAPSEALAQDAAALAERLAAREAAAWAGEATAEPPAAALDEEELRLAELDRRFAVALEVPVQRLYLLLAAVAFPSPESGARLVEPAGHLAGPAPIGSSSQPLAEWWGVASMLGALGAPAQIGLARAELVELLSRFARAHGRQLANAQRDVFHWQRLAAPVDLVDLDIASAVSLFARTLLQRDQRPLTLEEFAVEPLAEISLAVGLVLASGTPERPVQPITMPPSHGAPTGGLEPAELEGAGV